MEQRAAHAHAVAAVAEHLAWRERTQADEAQRVLSQCKVFFALLPDDSALELLAPKPDADDPAARIGVRLRSARRESGASRDTPEKRVACQKELMVLSCSAACSAYCTDNKNYLEAHGL
jgi:hypothetical protein